MIDRGKHNVLGVRVDAVDYEAAVQRIIDAAKASRPLGVSALAVHGLMTGALDPVHRFRLNNLELLVPDGQPVRWAMNSLYGTRLEDRVYGPRLMLETCQRAAEEGLPIFLYGTTDDLLDALVHRLEQCFPKVQIAGAQPSRFRCLTEQEAEDVVSAIRASEAAITFVGLGCPRQEVWVYEMKQALSMPVLAVGAAFAFHAGTLPQAPPFMQRHGLEWLYRFAQEPKRLWRRYLVYNSIFASMFMLQLSRLYGLDPDRSRQPTESVRYG